MANNETHPLSGTYAEGHAIVNPRKDWRCRRKGIRRISEGKSLEYVLTANVSTLASNAAGSRWVP